MLERLPSPDHVVAIRLVGTLEADDVEALKSVLDPALKQNERIGVCVDVTEFSDATGDAIVKDMQYELGLLGQIDKFRRVAIVTDKQWIAATLGFFGKLFPTIEIKIFPPDSGAEAIEWAGCHSVERGEHDHAIRFLATNTDSVLAFEIDGAISAGEMSVVIDKVNAFIAGHDKIRLLARIKNFAGMDPRVLLQGGLYSMKFEAIGKLDRYALVGAPEWLRAAASTVGPAMGATIKTFDADEEMEAWQWIGASPVQ